MDLWIFPGLRRSAAFRVWLSLFGGLGSRFGFRLGGGFCFPFCVLLRRWDRDRLGGFAVLLFVGIFGGFPGLDRLGAVL